MHNEKYLISNTKALQIDNTDVCASMLIKTCYLVITASQLR